MERSILLVLACVAISLFGAGGIVCVAMNAFAKAKKLSLWKMPRLRLAVLGVGAAAATVFGQKSVTGQLVYRCSFDSEAAVTNPAKGAPGTCNGATFVDGKYGSALHVPAHTTASEIPFPEGMPTNAGCVEFWAKIDSGKDKYGERGDPSLFRVYNGTNVHDPILDLSFNSNDGSDHSGIVAILLPARGAFTSASARTSPQPYAPLFANGDTYGWHHYALVWNVNGISSLEGAPLSAIILDGTKVSVNGSETVDAMSFAERMVQGTTMILGINSAQYSNNSYSIDELRIWDFDKTDFSQQISATYTNVTYVYDGAAHTLSEAVGGIGIESFRYATAADGPFADEMPTQKDAGALQVWYEVTDGVMFVTNSATVTVTPCPVTFTSASAEKVYDGNSLTAGDVEVTGNVPEGEGFTFDVTGSQTDVGKRTNLFTWVAQDGTNPDNYTVTTTYGTLRVKLSGPLFYRSSLDSEVSVTSPAKGAPGTCNGATFVDGKFGSALYVPAQTAAAAIPFANGLPAEKGCIEFYAKLSGSKATFGDAGDPMFLYFEHTDVNTDNRREKACGWIEFNANNGAEAGGLGFLLPHVNFYTGSWLGSHTYSSVLGAGAEFSWHHYAVAWNVDGIESVGGHPRFVFMLDGRVIGTTNGWGSWTKELFEKTMSRPITMYLSCPPGWWGHSPYTIDELRIWNFDKTEFSQQITAMHNDASYVYDGTTHTLGDAVGVKGGESFRYATSEAGPYTVEKPTLTDVGTLHIWYEVTDGAVFVTNLAAVTVTKCPVTFTSASDEKSYDGTPLTNWTVTVSENVPEGEGFTFSVTGTQTALGESENTFTWAAQDGTNPDNYEVTTIFGTLKVSLVAGMEYRIEEMPSGGKQVVIDKFPCEGGDITLPTELGGLPVGRIGELSGFGVTGVTVPAGVIVSGSICRGLSDMTNVTFDAAAAIDGPLDFRGCAALRAAVLPAGAELAPWTYLGCWELERVVFAGDPPFGGETDAADTASLLVASVRPASLLQMADMICYPASCAAKWEKSLRNLGYGGRRGTYEGEWTGEFDEVSAGGGGAVTPPDPGAAPGARYDARVGTASGTVLDGAAGWDVLGLPDGMTWDREAGKLGGTPVRSGTYDIMLVSGSGADTKLMRTTLEVAGYAVTTGYVGVAFKASGAPWNALASYKTALSGLAWKNKVLSGTPKKAGTLTYKTKAGEPVKLAILALPAGATGTFNGRLATASGKEYPVKVAATAAGKLTATVTKGTKSYSLQAAKWSKAAIGDVDGAEHRVKKDKYDVVGD